MKRFAAISTVVAFSFAGDCGTKTCDSGFVLDTATDECVEDSGCDNSIDDIFPEETGAYYRGTVEVEFDDREDDATLTVTGPDGEVAGSTEWSGDTLVFTPDSPLAPDTSYDIGVSYSCGDVDARTFTTSEVGAETNADALVGRTYSLDLATGRFVEPAGIGDLLGDFIEQEILIGATAIEGTDIQMIGAIAADGSNPPAQATCDPTIPFPIADFSANPFFEVGPETTTINVQGFSVTIDDLLISGAFGPDGSYVDGAVLAGTIDTRPLVPLLNENADCSDDAPRCCDTDVDPNCDPANDTETCCDEDNICDLAAQINVSCIPCGDGSDFCLSLFVDSMQAVEVSGLTLNEQHTPDEANPPASSTDVCTIEACSTEEACTAE